MQANFEEFQSNFPDKLPVEAMRVKGFLYTDLHEYGYRFLNASGKQPARVAKCNRYSS